jgi:hypothetical protein
MTILYILLGYLGIGLILHILVTYETGESDILFSLIWPAVALMMLSAIMWLIVSVVFIHNDMWEDS